VVVEGGSGREVEVAEHVGEGGDGVGEGDEEITQGWPSEGL
jgi:hypothetical protein